VVISASYMCHDHRCSLYEVNCFFTIHVILGYLLLYPVTRIITKLKYSLKVSAQLHYVMLNVSA
jgi:hypothetical protein